MGLGQQPHIPVGFLRPVRFGLCRFRSPLLPASHFVFFSSAYWDVSLRRVPAPFGAPGLQPRREVPFGDPRINGRLRLPGAYRSLPRPSSAPQPSHPPPAFCCPRCFCFGCVPASFPWFYVPPFWGMLTILFVLGCIYCFVYSLCVFDCYFVFYFFILVFLVLSVGYILLLRVGSAVYLF